MYFLYCGYMSRHCLQCGGDLAQWRATYICHEVISGKIGIAVRECRASPIILTSLSNDAVLHPLPRILYFRNFKWFIKNSIQNRYSYIPKIIIHAISGKSKRDIAIVEVSEHGNETVNFTRMS